MVRKVVDISGQKFGKLLVLRFFTKLPHTTLWECVCDCGNEKIAAAVEMKRGHTRSCGCLQIEAVKKQMTTHGETCGRRTSGEYRSWVSMRERCMSQTNNRYIDYGGRGITVCDRWMTFEYFLEDMGRKPFARATLDRVDNEKGYSKENCRWATYKTQANNTRKSTILTHDGISMTTSQWADLKGVYSSLLRARLRLGWSVAETIDTPPNKSNKIKTLRKRIP